MPYRNERHRQQVSAWGAARIAATRRLRDAHPDEWAALIEEECLVRGITPRRTRRDRRRQRLLAEVARLDAEDDHT